MVAVAGCSPDGSTALAPPSERVQRAVDLGRLAADTELDFVVGLSLRNPVGMRSLLADKVRPEGPLAPEQFVARYAPASDDYQQVVDWLRGNNLLVTRITDGRTTVSVHGRSADVERAFAVEMHQYREGSDIFAGAAGPLRLPADLAGHINGVVGLSGSRNWHTHYHIAAKPLAGGNAFTAADLISRYNTGGIANAGMGETVAILGAGLPPDPTIDIGHYVKAAFGTSMTPQYDQVQVGGANRDDAVTAENEEVENALDAEMVFAMAPNAHVVHVFAATNTPGLFTDGISYIVNQVPQAHAVSVSYGSCERGSSTEMPVMNTLFQQAQAMGQQWFFSSGDSGTDTCGDGAGNKHVAVDWPASSPYVVGVGGTMISNNVEVAWNANSSMGGAGGGGPSEMFAKPAFQTAATPADGARDIPDVAAIAGAPGVNVLTFNQTIPLEGTSVSSPLWAGMWALVDQAKGGKGIPDALTKIYAAGKSNGFNDITMGDNGGPDGKSAGYPALAGYDLATGWGTPNVPNLITAIQ